MEPNNIPELMKTLELFIFLKKTWADSDTLKWEQYNVIHNSK